MKPLLILIMATAFAHAQYYGGESSGEGNSGTGAAPQHGATTQSGTFTTPNAGLGDNAPATTRRGTDIDGANTMGQPAYPNSGMTRNRSTDVMGDDMTSATYDSSNLDPEVPDRNPTAKTIERGSTQTGPFKTTGRQSQEEDTPSEQKRKQKGE